MKQKKMDQHEKITDDETSHNFKDGLIQTSREKGCLADDYEKESGQIESKLLDTKTKADIENVIWQNAHMNAVNSTGSISDSKTPVDFHQPPFFLPNGAGSCGSDQPSLRSQTIRDQLWQREHIDENAALKSEINSRPGSTNSSYHQMFFSNPYTQNLLQPNFNVITDQASFFHHANGGFDPQYFNEVTHHFRSSIGGIQELQSPFLSRESADPSKVSNAACSDKMFHNDSLQFQPEQVDQIQRQHNEAKVNLAWHGNFNRNHNNNSNCNNNNNNQCLYEDVLDEISDVISGQTSANLTSFALDNIFQQNSTFFASDGFDADNFSFDFFSIHGSRLNDNHDLLQNNTNLPKDNFSQEKSIEDLVNDDTNTKSSENFLCNKSNTKTPVDFCFNRQISSPVIFSDQYSPITPPSDNIYENDADAFSINSLFF